MIFIILLKEVDPTKSITVGNALQLFKVTSMVEVLFMMVLGILKSTSSGLTPGTSDFCCEGWFYYTDLSYALGILGNVNNNANTTDWQLIHQAKWNFDNMGW